jgi:hypothetical protein
MRQRCVARTVLASTLLISALSACADVRADRPNFVKQLFQRRGASESKLELQDKHGPWLILAATFSGDDAKSNAVAFAKELGNRLRVPTFIMQQEFKEEQAVAKGERIRTDKLGRLIPKQLSARYANNFPNHSVAVLVGEFHSKDDPQIDGLLQKVRDFVPKSNIPGFAERENINFLTRNPLLPEDFFQAPKIDRFVEDLNRQDWIKHSVLDCPGRFTVRVATFRGSEVITVAAESGSGSDPTNALDRAASKAHKLTTALRSRGVEAYEFHDRYGSYVMIGSFDALGQELKDGQFQYDPGIVAILQEYCGYREVTAKDPITGAVSKTFTLKSEGRIPFDVEGKATAVPRPETSRIYSGSLFK